MTAGPATLTARPLARNRPVPIAPPSAIIACWAVESWRASTCSLRTAAGCSVRGMSLTSGSVSAIARPATRSGYPLLLWAPKGARRSALSALGGRGLLADLEPARPRHGGEVDVAVETDRDVVEDQGGDEIRVLRGTGDAVERAGEGAACRDSLRGGSPRSPAGYRGIGSASVASSRRYHTRIASARRIDARP